MLSRPDARLPRLLLVADVAVKAVVIGGLLFAVAHPDWPRFAGKAFGARLAAYPFALLIVPVLSWRWSRRRSGGYPAAVDLLVSTPFAVDVVGNITNAYDSVDHFDDVAHFVNWALLFAAVALVLPRTLPTAAQLGLVVGLGALVALCWELAEFVTFLHDSPERATAYTDTLGDMTLGTLGALAAGLTVTLCRHRRRGARAG